MSSPGDGSVEVRIAGKVDSSLPASVALTKAQLNSINTEVRKFADEMVKSGTAGDVAARQQLAGLEAVQAGVRAAYKEQVAAVRAAEAAEHGLQFATSGSVQEVIRLGHEALSGNFSRMPGSVMVLTSRMGGLTAATLGSVAAYTALGAAALAPTIALGVLAYRQLEAARNAQALEAGFQLTGRGAIYTSQGIAGEIDALSQLGDTGNKTATALVQFDSTHANLNATLANAANQLIPAYVRELGDKAPQALNNLKGRLAEISTSAIPQSIHEFQELNRTTLNLPATAVPAIEQMIRSGNGLGAAMAIVAAEGQRTGTKIESLSTQIKTTNTDLANQTTELNTLKAAMRAAGADGASMFAADIGKAAVQVELLTGKLQLLKNIQAATSPGGSHDLSGEDRYVAQLHVQADLAHESAQQRHIDEALIERATERLRDQGRAEQEVVKSAKQAREILGEQAEETARLAAQSYKTPKGPNVAKQDQHIGDEDAKAEQRVNELRIQNAEETNQTLLQQGQITAEQFLAQAQDLEKQRLAAVLKGIAERESADSHDKVAFARDEADKAVAVQESANRMAAIRRTYNQQVREANATDLQDFVSSEERKLDRGLSTIEALLRAHRISDQQAHDLEHQLTLAIEAEVLKRWDDAHASLVKGTKDYAEAMKQRQQITDSFTKHVVQQDNTLEDQESQKWHTLATSIEGTFNSALSQMMIHGGTFRQFMTSIAEGVADAFLQAGLKMAEDWIERQVMAAVATDATQALSAQAQIDTQAAIAGATAYAQYAGNPPLAAFMAGQAVTATEGFSTLISARRGEYKVEKDGQLYELHAGEGVMPAAVMENIRQWAAQPVMERRMPTAAAQMERMVTAMTTSNSSSSVTNGGDIHLGDYRPELHFHGPAKQSDIESALRNDRAGFYRFAENELRNGHLRKLARTMR